MTVSVKLVTLNNQTAPMAKRNISTGPMSQFCAIERPRTRLLRKTSPSFS